MFDTGHCRYDTDYYDIDTYYQMSLLLRSQHAGRQAEARRLLLEV